MTTTERQQADSSFSDGWSSGNYDNAYKGSLPPDIDVDVNEDWQGGYLLGYFSGYEEHEIPHKWRSVVCRLRSTQADRCERLGITNEA